MLPRLALAALLLMAAPAGAVTKIGIGSMSCGSWTAEHRANGQASDNGHRQTQWIFGYLSGAAEWMPAENDPLGILSENERTYKDPLGGMDADGLVAWMARYCLQHPLDRLGDAANALMNELLRRAQ